MSPSVRRAAWLAIVVTMSWLLLVASTQAQLVPLDAAFAPPHGTANTPATVADVHVRVGGLDVDRAEVDHDIVITAEMRDSRTAVKRWFFDWHAPVGEIRGEGPSIVWRIPRGTVTPLTSNVTLDFVEETPDFASGWPPAMTTRRTSVAAPAMIVNDSVAELTRMAHAFLVDRFANRAVSPEECLVDFTDDCQGKADELEDIRANRRDYVIHSGSYSVAKIEFHPTADLPAWAEISGPCEFHDFDNEKQREHVAKGICSLTARYIKPRWWLCESHTDKDSGTQLYLDTRTPPASPKTKK